MLDLLSVVNDNPNTSHYSEIASESGTFIVTPEKFDIIPSTKMYQNTKYTSSPHHQLMFPSPISISASSPKTKQWVQELCQMPSPTTHKKNQQTRQKLISICKKQKQMLNQKRAIISRLKKQNLKNILKKQKPNIKTLMQNIKFKSQNSKAIVSMQIQHKNRKPWTSEEKKIAFSIYYKSPSTYKYMRKNKITLPGESTIRRWLQSINYSPGFPNEYIQQVKYKVSSMNYHQKKCVVLLDEVALMKCLEFNKSLDCIEGFQDLGEFGQSAQPSKNALVIMIRGLYQNWKFPFAFFFSGSGIKGSELVKIITLCVKKLDEVGLIAVSIVCDQGSQNRKMFDLLGGTKTNPVVDINGKQICLIYDVPHLIKSIRNNLMNGDFEIGGKKICFKDIEDTYAIDVNSKTARSMPKITKTHLNPNTWQKMSVKYATQIFSKSVSASIRTCIATGELKSDTAGNTAEFIMQINDTFDILNSKNLYDKNPNSRPLSNANHYLIDTLKNTRNIFLQAKKLHKQKNNNNSQPPCFIGMIWSINSILALFEREKYDELNNCDSGNTYFLLTNRLCQDPLENLFSIMRQKNGYNRNPTSRMFRNCYANICTFSLMKCSELCNCEDDNDVFLTIDVLTDISNNEGTTTQYSREKEELDELLNSKLDLSPILSPCTQHISEKTTISTLETCSILYFTGYLVKKCLDFFNCDICLDKLIKNNNTMNDKNELLIINKMYEGVYSGGLKTPSDEIVKICTMCLKHFENNWEFIQLKKGIVNILMQSIARPLLDIIPLFDSHQCKEHYLYIVRLLFVTKIFHTCKQMNEKSSKFISLSTKPHSKLRILNNK